MLRRHATVQRPFHGHSRRKVGAQIQLPIRSHNETLSVAAMLRSEDCSPVGIRGRHAVPTPTALLRLSAIISYTRSHHAVLRVYDEAGNVIETREHADDFEEW